MNFFKFPTRFSGYLIYRSYAKWRSMKGALLVQVGVLNGKLLVEFGYQKLTEIHTLR